MSYWQPSSLSPFPALTPGCGDQRQDASLGLWPSCFLSVSLSSGWAVNRVWFGDGATVITTRELTGILPLSRKQAGALSGGGGLFSSILWGEEMNCFWTQALLGPMLGLDLSCVVVFCIRT